MGAFAYMSQKAETVAPLTAAALPRAYRLGFRLTGDAKEFLAVASMIEAVL